MQSESKYCPDCGADNFPLADKCFLCQRELKSVKPTEIILAELVPERTKNDRLELVFGIVAAIVVFIFVLIGISIGREDPRNLIGLVLVVLPGVVIAGIGILRRRAKGESVGWGRALLIFFTSTFISIAVAVSAAVVLFVVAVVLLLSACFAAMASGNMH